MTIRQKVGLCQRAGNNPTEQTAENRLQKVTHRRWDDARSRMRSSPITWISYLVGTGHAGAIDAIAYGRDRAMIVVGLVRSRVPALATSLMFGPQPTPVISDLNQCIAVVACAKYLLSDR